MKLFIIALILVIYQVYDIFTVKYFIYGPLALFLINARYARFKFKVF